MKTTTWLITAKSNLHVGNENNTSYGIIDKAIQREALTDLPCIHSSSLKGAINEYCLHNTDLTPCDRIKIFGADKKKEDTTIKKGNYVFFDAKLLLYPDQQDNEKLYNLTTPEEVLQEFIDRIRLFDAAYNSTPKKLKEELKNKLKLKDDIDFDNEKFKSIRETGGLPIIARNCLENGESANLWYEEILPQETVFYTIILVEEDDILTKHLDGKIVQIGANATIGYGYCRFTKLYEKDENNK
ncbi:hypothetical protein EZS27_031112 [termite gut metagenome]|uniref:CRISPR type III-associated protein domain-containing protein n=1 Tax=termite gut metagenome TaxID=433724 RepID=A0A5J4QD77_9ZZZZ